MVRCYCRWGLLTNNSRADPGVALVCRGDDELYFDAERVFPVRLGGSPRRPCCCCNRWSEVNAGPSGYRTAVCPGDEVRGVILRRRAGFVPSTGLGFPKRSLCSRMGVRQKA